MTDNQPAPATVDEIAAGLQKLETEIESAIQALEVNVDEIDFLGGELTAFEESEHFKGLTEHSHQQLMLDCREYICSLREGLDKLREKLAAAKYSQQLQAEITKLEQQEGTEK